jgi:predicted nucleotidyltransferase
MTDLVEQRRPELIELCRRHHVKTLEIFGSAAAGSFNPLDSDLDFLVDFVPLPPSGHSKAYFGLWFDLEDLFGRKVDLVETRAVANPYFLRSINESRRVLYAA